MSKDNEVLSKERAQYEQDLNRIRARFGQAAANSTAALDAAYDEAMRYLNARYHTFPSEIKDLKISAEAAARISQLNAHASHAGEKLQFSEDGRYVWQNGRWVSVGKAVF